MPDLPLFFVIIAIVVTTVYLIVTNGLALCDMIAKHEQPPVDRKLLCGKEAWEQWLNGDDDIGEEWVGLRAIELWEEGFGK